MKEFNRARSSSAQPGPATHGWKLLLVKLTTLRLSNFQSFGPAATEIQLQDLTYVLGPNGAGKTAVLEALSKLFSPVAPQRRIVESDFHVPIDGEVADHPVLWLEAEFELPESADTEPHPSVPPFFSHMTLEAPDGPPKIRVRLTATLEPDGYVEEKIEYILESDADGEPVRRSDMPRSDRAHIEVHYLPARRDPADHISYATTSLLGRIMRAADWSAERELLTDLTDQITSTLADNGALKNLGERLADSWTEVHRGQFFKDPAIAFGRGEFEAVLRQLTLTFSPSHGRGPLSFERLSDGQQSLLYISLVLAWRTVVRGVLAGENETLDPDRLRAPVHTILAIEEPENSLSPQYLGRVIKVVREACAAEDTQALVATHAPALLRRAAPESIRFLRLDGERSTTVRTIALPADDLEAAKYVREAVQAFPELYFARLVVLGEGDSELVVLPRVLGAAGIVEDDTSVSVVPLGGRHVNHFWRLLNDLDIPHVTLLDLDSARYGGGWGRVRNALKQVNKVRPGTFKEEAIKRLPKWNDDTDFPRLSQAPWEEGKTPIAALERHDVFFSDPVDLDLLMMTAFPEAYEVETSTPSEGQLETVLGRSRVNVERLDDDTKALFANYIATFQQSSKPAAHLAALSTLDDEELIAGLPAVLTRLIERVQAKLDSLPE